MFPSLLAATQAVAQAEPQSPLIDFKTALLVVVTVALYVVTRKLVGLHRRIEVLETSAPFPVAPTNPGIAPETVAAISAAVHTTLRAHHRILSIGEPCPKRQAWSVEGRRQVFSSHNVR